PALGFERSARDEDGQVLAVRVESKADDGGFLVLLDRVQFTDFSLARVPDADGERASASIRGEATVGAEGEMVGLALHAERAGDDRSGSDVPEVQTRRGHKHTGEVSGRSAQDLLSVRRDDESAAERRMKQDRFWVIVLDRSDTAARSQIPEIQPVVGREEVLAVGVRDEITHSEPAPADRSQAGDGPGRQGVAVAVPSIRQRCRGVSVTNDKQTQEKHHNGQTNHDGFSAHSPSPMIARAYHRRWPKSSDRGGRALNRKRMPSAR